MSNFSLVSLPSFPGIDGNLTVLQNSIPFEILRVFWIYDADGFMRGGHRHKETRQALIAINGEVEIYLNDGFHESTIILNSPNTALIVEPEDWHTMKFNKSSILLVMASTFYSADDYIDAPY